MTIVDKIKELRSLYPDKTALFDLNTGKKVTFTQIDEKSNYVCDYLRKKNFKKGD